MSKIKLELYRVKEKIRSRPNSFTGEWGVVLKEPLMTVKGEVVDENLRMLSGEQWTYACGRESVGGNAEGNHCCVNAVVDIKTGEIMLFSNSPKDYLRDGCNAVRFLIDVSAVPKTIIDQITFDGEFTEAAKQNIVSAVEMKNAV
jgi:hypothetical protein